MSKFSICLCVLLSLLLINACMDPDPVETCDTTDMSYNDDIKEIFDASCAFAGCHDMDAASTIGSLSNYDNAVAFVAFERILGALNHEETFKPMPYPAGSAKIEQCKIDKITAWIAAGTPE